MVTLRSLRQPCDFSVYISLCASHASRHCNTMAINACKPWHFLIWPQRNGEEGGSQEPTSPGISSSFGRSKSRPQTMSPSCCSSRTASRAQK